MPLTVGRGPVPRRASVGETALAGVQFSRRSGDRGGQAPALRARKGFASLSPVQDQAITNYSGGNTHHDDGQRGGNPLGCASGIRGPPRYDRKRHPLTVGRGPVPRRASVEETALAGMRFRAGRAIAGDRPPRYGPGRGSPLYVPFGIRRAISGETRSPARMAGEGPRATGPEGVLLSMSRSGSGDPELQSLGTRALAGDRPPRYGLILLIVIIM